MRYGFWTARAQRRRRTIEVTSAKQRALLAILLLSANQVVSSDALIDALWEDEAPEGQQRRFRCTFRNCASCSRKERLRTKPPGYMLRVEPDRARSHAVRTPAEGWKD